MKTSFKLITLATAFTILSVTAHGSVETKESKDRKEVKESKLATDYHFKHNVQGMHNVIVNSALTAFSINAHGNVAYIDTKGRINRVLNFTKEEKPVAVHWFGERDILITEITDRPLTKEWALHIKGGLLGNKDGYRPTVIETRKDESICPVQLKPGTLLVFKQNKTKSTLVEITAPSDQKVLYSFEEFPLERPQKDALIEKTYCSPDGTTIAALFRSDDNEKREFVTTLCFLTKNDQGDYVIYQGITTPELESGPLNARYTLRIIDFRWDGNDRCIALLENGDLYILERSHKNEHFSKRNRLKAPIIEGLSSLRCGTIHPDCLLVAVMPDEESDICDTIYLFEPDNGTALKERCKDTQTTHAFIETLHWHPDGKSLICASKVGLYKINMVPEKAVTHDENKSSAATQAASTTTVASAAAIQAATQATNSVRDAALSISAARQAGNLDELGKRIKDMQALLAQLAKQQ